MTSREAASEAYTGDACCGVMRIIGLVVCSMQRTVLRHCVLGRSLPALGLIVVYNLLPEDVMECVTVLKSILEAAG